MNLVEHNFLFWGFLAFGVFEVCSGIYNIRFTSGFDLETHVLDFLNFFFNSLYS